MTDPSREINIDAFGEEAYAVTEQDEVDGNPPLCWCGKGYVGHDPAHERASEVRITSGGDHVNVGRNPVRDPVARAKAEHEQMVAQMGGVPMEPSASGEIEIVYDDTPEGTRRPRQVTPLPIPVAIIWPSRTDGPTPHIVTLALWHCTCEAAMLGNRECWAIKEAKRLYEGAR